MTDEQVEQWLQEWKEAHMQETFFHEDPSELSSEAEHCRYSAKELGISTEQLTRVAGGSLEENLMDYKNRFTQEHVDRVAAKDR